MKNPVTDLLRLRKSIDNDLYLLKVSAFFSVANKRLDESDAADAVNAIMPVIRSRVKVYNQKVRALTGEGERS